MGNVLTINGKKYDAVTGKLITSNTSTAPKTKKRASGASMDGVVTKRRKTTTARKPQSAAKVHSQKTKQKSQTLMRSAVKKPKAKTPRSATPITKSKLGTSKERAKTAAAAKKSPQVSKFASAQSEPRAVVKKVQHLPVKQQAKKKVATAAPKRHKAAAKVGKAASAHTVKKKNVAAAKMIETALAKADSHELPELPQTKKRRKLAHRLGVSARAVTMSAAILAAVLFGGFIALQNVPNLSMRLAATRAGFDATLPRYNPSGFSFHGPINYSSGQVTVTFKSNTDNREYDLTQRTSNWNSEALLNNFVAVGGSQYQTFEDRGRTLYIYDGSNATWVDNGIWYQIEGDSRMSTDQLIRVAASM